MSKARIPLSEPWISGNEWKYVRECLDTNWVSSAGKFVEKFESAIRRKFGVKRAVACMNATSGLFLALKVSGVGPRDEVIVPALTFISPVNAVRYLGAEPVFMDCDDYMNIDPEKIDEFCRKECKAASNGLVNKRTGRPVKAIVPVHIFGNPCDMDRIMTIAKKYRLKVIEDAAESIGASYTRGTYSGRSTGTIGDLGVYSFNGNKIITSGGGGMIVSNNIALAEKARYLANQAKDDPVRYVHEEVGYNFRLTNMQAALGLAQFERLEGLIKAKKRNYALYKRMLEGTAGVEILGTPEGTSPNYWFYSLIVEKKGFGMDRDAVMRHLQAKGIQTRPVWYLNHLQRPYRGNRAYRIEKAPRFWRTVLNLPCNANLKREQIKYVTSAIRGLWRGK
ncbi:MAG: LegC family aminotransferase [Candidatus Omnitrophota bacterium]|jgi:perosamine synthetase